MNESGCGAWSDARLRECSDRGGKARVAQGGVNEIGSSPVSQEREPPGINEHMLFAEVFDVLVIKNKF